MNSVESADCAVLCAAWQRTGLRNQRLHRPLWSKTWLPLGSHFTVTGNFNLNNIILKIEYYKIKMAYWLIKDIKGLFVQVIKSYESPIEKKYAGYTVLPGIAPPLPPSL
jgi:hypothetical protein